MVIRPPRWRCFLFSWLPFLVGSLLAHIFVSAVLPTPPTSSVLLFAIPTMLGAAIPAWLVVRVTQERLTIRLTQGVVQGPPTWGWTDVHIPLTQVNYERTCSQTWLQRWCGYRYVWSITGDKLVFQQVVFDRAQVHALLTLLNCVAKRTLND